MGVPFVNGGRMTPAHKFSVLASYSTWYNSWCHQMETFSVLLALCAGNSSVTSEFPSQRPMTRSFDVLQWPFCVCTQLMRDDVTFVTSSLIGWAHTQNDPCIGWCEYKNCRDTQPYHLFTPPYRQRIIWSDVTELLQMTMSPTMSRGRFDDFWEHEKNK